MSLLLHTYSDGGARGNPGPSGIGFVVCDAQDNVLSEGAECIGHATNNVAEYRAMMKALEAAKAQGATHVLCTADSQLLIYQLQGKYRIKNAALLGLAEKVRSLAKAFESVTWRHVPREHAMITRADKNLNQALDKEQSMKSHL